MKTSYTLNQLRDYQCMAITRKGETIIYMYSQEIKKTKQQLTDFLLINIGEVKETFREKQVYFDNKTGLVTESLNEILQVYSGRNVEIFTVGKGKEFFTWVEQIGQHIKTDITDFVKVKSDYTWLKEGEAVKHLHEPTDEDFEKMDQEIAQYAASLNETEDEARNKALHDSLFKTPQT